MRALFLTPPGDLLDFELDNTLAAIQQAVDGQFDIITITTDAVLLVNMHAHKLGLPRNERATLLASQVLDEGEYVAGPAVLVGAIPPSEEFSDAPGDLVTIARALTPATT